MPRERYWALVEVERNLRNALSMVRQAERVLVTPSEIRDDVSKIAEDLEDAVARAAAGRRRVLEETSEVGARAA